MPVPPVGGDFPADALTLTQVAERIGVNRKTPLTWLKVGCKVRGTLVKLRATRVGGRWRVRSEDVDLFLEELAAAAEVPPPPPRPLNAARVARVNAECEAMGW